MIEYLFKYDVYTNNVQRTQLRNAHAAGTPLFRQTALMLEPNLAQSRTQTSSDAARELYDAKHAIHVT